MPTSDLVRPRIRQATAKASDTIHKQAALKLVISEVKLILGSDSLPDDFAELVRLQANDFFDNVTDHGSDPNEDSDKDRPVIKRDAEQDSFKELLDACFYAASLDELKEEASE